MPHTIFQYCNVLMPLNNFVVCKALLVDETYMIEITDIFHNEFWWNINIPNNFVNKQILAKKHISTRPQSSNQAEPSTVLINPFQKPCQIYNHAMGK